MRTFLSTNGSWICRVTCRSDGRWIVEQVLAGQALTCLALDPFKPGVVYAGTRTSGVLHSFDGG